MFVSHSLHWLLHCKLQELTLLWKYQEADSARITELSRLQRWKMYERKSFNSLESLVYFTW